MSNHLLGTTSFALVAGLCLLIPVSAEAEMTDSEIAALIPADQTVARVLVPRPPARLEELTERIRKATRENPRWWTDHRSSAPEGEPIPYHENLGVSEEEYGEFLSLLGKKSLVETGEVTLNVTSSDERTFVISCDDTLAAFPGVTVNLAADKVDTQYGSAEERIYIEAGPQQKLTGPWNGVEWKFIEIEGERATGTMVQFAVGKLEESGRGILYYKGSKASGMAHGSGPHGDAAGDETTLILTYPLAGAK